MLGLRKTNFQSRKKYNCLAKKPKSENIYKKWKIVKYF